MLPANKIRGLVSKKKRRYQQDGFDLDLSYITDRIIAMGFPSEHLEGLYRNPMTEVQRSTPSKLLQSLQLVFFPIHQENEFSIYLQKLDVQKEDMQPVNFKIESVCEFPFDDHNPCQLDRVSEVCKDMHDWLQANQKNVIVVHCKAGKGRTGMIICCYLQYARVCNTASEALQLFAIKRTLNAKGVTLHSQRRYVSYFEHVIAHGKQSAQVRLERIRMYTLPNMQKGGGCEPWFSVSNGDVLLYYSEQLKGKRGNQVIDFDCGNCILKDDTKIEFFHRNLKVEFLI